MLTTTFTELRKNAKKYFDAAEKGERIQVLRHGKPIAEISPPSLLGEIRSWKRPALRRKIKGVSLSAQILKQRAEER